jgi:hypothetical protein
MTDNVKKRRQRRTYEDRIAELESQIQRQKEKLTVKKERIAKKREVPASIKSIPKIAKKLQDFASLALADKRMDVFNSVSMFLAGLQRMYEQEMAQRAEEFEDETDEVETDELADEELTPKKPLPRTAQANDDVRSTRGAPAPRAREAAREVGRMSDDDAEPLRREPAARTGPATKAERMFDERLKAVAQDEMRRRIDSTPLSEWER